ncbi:hypothetical protein ABPG77_008636 [Micractinium sp. CCAP 211/92]
MAVEAKRARLDSVPDDIGQLNAERELANVLERLLNVGGDESGLDELLDELGRAQASLGGSKQAHLAFQAIADAQQKLQAAIVALQSAVDRYTPPPGYQPPQSSGVDDAYVHGLLSYAHRLSYSSSAPLGYQPGQPLLFFRPPAPQEAEMRASQLHAFNREWEERQQALQVQQVAAARDAAVPAGAAPTAAAVAQAPAGGDLAALAAKHGLDVQQLLASMPPGWKPGDPITVGPAAAPAAAGPPAAAPTAALAVSAAATAAPASAETATEPAVPAEEAEAPPAPRLAGIFLNQVDFADLEYGVSSGDDDSEEDSEEDSD